VFLSGLVGVGAVIGWGGLDRDHFDPERGRHQAADVLPASVSAIGSPGSGKACPDA